MKRKTLDILKEEFLKIIKENGLDSEEVLITAAPLSTEEVIGNPEDKDYPLVIGKERMMQAEFRGSVGQAFTDRYGNFKGRLADIATIDLTNNFRRAVFISSLNAVLRHLGLINKTRHCHDKEPRQCSAELINYIKKTYSFSKVALVGFQPRMVEALSPRFEVRVTDLDQANIGTEKFGIVVQGSEKTGENLEWCDLALVTGTTVVNDTIDQFMIAKPVIFYGVTISGAAQLLGMKHFCYYGR